MLAATLVAPGHDKVIPLEPEFIVPQDGAEKQDCENMAAKRWLAAHAQRYAALDPVYLGDDLFSRQPLCQAVLDTGGHLIFVCKPSSHPLIQEYLTGADLAVLEQTLKRGKQRFVHRYRWLRMSRCATGAMHSSSTGLRSRSSTPAEPGCRFAPRCRFAMPACTDAVPELRAVEAGHKVACILY